ncbi:MAG: hypothetical protein WAM28_03920, partial [Chlamydiales bacterium]
MNITNIISQVYNYSVNYQDESGEETTSLITKLAAGILAYAAGTAVTGVWSYFQSRLFENGLNQWVNNAPQGEQENRQEAARRIKTFMLSSSQRIKLSLNGLQLTS